MIDRIDNTNYYNNYPTTQKKKVDTNDFSLNLKNKPFTEEKEFTKEDTSGVQLDLYHDTSSSMEKERTHEKQPSVQGNTVSSGVTLEQMKQVIHSFVQLVKETWNAIWNEPSVKEEMQSQESKEDVVDIVDATVDNQALFEAKDMAGNNSYTARGEDKPEDILVQRALKSKDLNRLTDMITQNGKLKLAKNSQLLTTYDRQGKIVQLDGSEKERILRGDKNLMKL